MIDKLRKEVEVWGKKNVKKEESLNDYQMQL